MSTDEVFMEEAIKQARIALEGDEVPIGAVLVRDGEIIARAYNKVEESKNPLAHAEMLILQEIGLFNQGKWQPNLRLYVTLEPCIMCYGAIVLARIEYLIYGATDKKAGFSSFIKKRTGLNHVPYIIPNVHEEACSKLLIDFFKSKRRGSRVV